MRGHVRVSMRQALITAAISGALAVVILFFANGVITEQARVLNAKASAAAAEARASSELADLALEAHRVEAARRAVAETQRDAALLQLAAVRRLPKIVLPTVVPDTCAPFAARIDQLETEVAVLDRIVATDSMIIKSLTLSNRGLTRDLSDASAALKRASAELATQATRTEIVPRRFLGIKIPKVVLVPGYGAMLANGRVQHGPVLAIGISL